MHGFVISDETKITESLYCYVTVPRKQLNQDFSTNMLLKIYLCIILMLTMAPNIPQCTLKMLVIQPGPPFHFNEVEMVKKGIERAKKLSGHD